MRQFRRKHFRKGLPAFFDVGLQAAIRGRAALAAIAGVFRQKKEHRDNSGCRIFIGGDAGEAGRVRQKLGGRKKVVDVLEEAEEVLLCEGKEFSFREAIGWLETGGRAGSRRVLFHASGSGSAAGSPDSKDRGEVLQL